MTLPLWTGEEIAEATGGKLQGYFRASGVSIDSRSIQPGEVFFAIEGEKFDGHNFVADVLAKGAAGAVVSRIPDGIKSDAPLVVVADTTKALAALGQAARKRTSARIVAVTGSVGKTSTKEMLRFALSALGETYATRGNLNNHYGVPLSLANMPRSAQFGIFELGMNHAGEIRALTRQVQPEVALITTIEAVHLEFFDSVDAIADAKAEIFEGLSGVKVAIIPADSLHAVQLAEKAHKAGAREIFTFGSVGDAHARLGKWKATGAGMEVTGDLGDKTRKFTVGIAGQHVAMNALAVLLAVHALGGDDAKAAAALAHFDGLAGRGKAERLAFGGGAITLIDDSYNASPASMRAAFAALSAYSGRRIALLGDMLELGNQAPALHAGLAEDLAKAGIHTVHTAGAIMENLHKKLPEKMRGRHAANATQLAEQIADAFQPGDAVLVKGSRGSRMDIIVEHIRRLAQPDNNRGKASAV